MLCLRSFMPAFEERSISSLPDGSSKHQALLLSSARLASIEISDICRLEDISRFAITGFLLLSAGIRLGHDEQTEGSKTIGTARLRRLQPGYGNAALTHNGSAVSTGSVMTGYTAANDNSDASLSPALRAQPDMKRQSFKWSELNEASRSISAPIV